MTNIALVGCGGMAAGHANTLQRTADAKLVATVDIKPERAEAFREKYAPDARVYDSFDALLANPPAKLDAVVLVTPHTVHYPHAKAALERGWHVLTEKPMVTSSEHAYDLWRLVKQTGKVLAIAFQAPYCAEYQAIRQLRTSGAMGQVQLIQGWLAQGWKTGTANSWRHDPRLSGGGQMYDSGSHVLNAMMWIMDEPVVEVACMVDNQGMPVDINGAAVLKFRSGALGSFCIGGNCPGWDVSINVQTDTMYLRTGPHGGSLECSRQGRKFYPPVPHADDPTTFTPLRNFLDAIAGKAELVSPVRYGVLLSALMDALYESATSGKPVKVRPVPDQL
jgi:predicted dehydrogenase